MCYAGTDKEYHLTLLMTYDVMCSASELFERLVTLYTESKASADSPRPQYPTPSYPPSSLNQSPHERNRDSKEHFILEDVE